MLNGASPAAKCDGVHAKRQSRGLRLRAHGHACASCDTALKPDVQGAVFVTTTGTKDRYKGCEYHGYEAAFEPITRSRRANFPGAFALAGSTARMAQYPGARALAGSTARMARAPGARALAGSAARMARAPGAPAVAETAQRVG